jgi:hypothetical protein
LLALAVIYQLFFRYSFERGPGYALYRLDHLTGATCETLPLNVCAGERVSFTPDPTAYPHPLEGNIFADPTPTPNAFLKGPPTSEP